MSGGGVSEDDWAAAVEALRSASEVHLVCHVRPDGDALGSAIAVGLALRSLGKPAVVSFGDEPFEVPRSLAFLPGLDLLAPPTSVPPEPEVMAVFDAANIDRLGLLAPAARGAGALVVVDHHESNTRFGTHHLVDPSAPAAAVLAEELIRRLGSPLSREVATALYTGVATDTGSFRYAGTTPATHELAGRLLATGIRHDLISRAIWDTAAFGYLKVLARALDRAALEPEAAGGLGLVWTVIPRVDRERHGLTMDQVEGVIDVVRKTSEAEVAAVLKEDVDGSYQVSTRSKGRVDVGAICCALGGGGHRFAAGFTALEDPGTTVFRLLGMLARAVRGYADSRPERSEGLPAPALGDAS